MRAPPCKPVATPTSKAILCRKQTLRAAQAAASALQEAASQAPALRDACSPDRPTASPPSPAPRATGPNACIRPGIAALVLLAASFLWPLPACSPPPGHAPVARLTIEPAYVPANEATEVLLDGRRSCDQFDAPDGCVAADETPPLDCPNGLRYHWTVSRDMALLEGGPDQPWMRVSVTTDQPVSVTLTVTDCDGRTASITRQIGVILTWPDRQE